MRSIIGYLCPYHYQDLLTQVCDRFQSDLVYFRMVYAWCVWTSNDPWFFLLFGDIHHCRIFFFSFCIFCQCQYCCSISSQILHNTFIYFSKEFWSWIINLFYPLRLNFELSGAVGYYSVVSVKNWLLINGIYKLLWHF